MSIILVQWSQHGTVWCFNTTSVHIHPPFILSPEFPSWMFHEATIPPRQLITHIKLPILPFNSRYPSTLPSICWDKEATFQQRQRLWRTWRYCLHKREIPWTWSVQCLIYVAQITFLTHIHDLFWRERSAKLVKEKRYWIFAQVKLICNTCKS